MLDGETRWRPFIWAEDLSLRSGATYPGVKRGEQPLLHYLVLLRMGFTLPRPSPDKRCALTAPFHPYRPLRPAVCFLWHFPSGHPAWMLSSIRLYGVRTFLDPCSQWAAAAFSISFNPLRDLLIFPRNKVFARNNRRSAAGHLCECRRLFVLEPRRSSRRNCRCATEPLRGRCGSS